MALNTAISDALKNVTAGRRVKFQAEPYVWTNQLGSAVELYWSITRTAQSSYQYLALTKDAAESAAQSLVAQYTRPYARWTAELDESTTPPTPIIIKNSSLECPSDITPAQSAGSSWEVDVDVNDVDTVIVTDKPETYADMEELFTLAMARDAAADGEVAIVITDANWNSAAGKTVAFYDVANIADFDPSLVAVERKQGANWVTVAGSVAGAGGVEFPAAQNMRFRVSYNSGAVVSNEFATSDAPLPALSMSAGTWNKATQSESGSILLTIPFSASGAPQALAGITNVAAWKVRVVGQTTGTDYSAAFTGTWATTGQSRPNEVADLGGGRYSMAYWIPALISPADTSLAVTIAFSRGDGPSASATASYTYTDYFDVESLMLLDASPELTRVRLVVASDLGESTIRRATISVVGSYPGVGFTADKLASGTVERIFALGDGLYSIVVSFTTLEYRLASYPLAISGKITEEATGLAISFASAQSLDVTMPAKYITEVTTSGALSVVKYKALDVGDDWRGDSVDMKFWREDQGEWVIMIATTGAGEFPDFTANFTGTNFAAEYLGVYDPSAQAIVSVFACNGSIYTRIVAAKWSNGEVEMVFDQKHSTFDPSLLAVFDATTGAALSDVAVAGDTIKASLTGDGDAHSVYLVYNSGEKSNAVTVATATGE